MAAKRQTVNAPTDLHRRLKARAARAGMSLSDYLLDESSQAAERPTQDEMRARLSGRAAIESLVDPAEIIRDLRDGR